MKQGQMPSLSNPALEKSEAVSASEGPKLPPKSIKVIALGSGFFAQERKKEGDQFEVPSMQQLGSWMKCLDPVIEKQHQEALKQKRKKVNEAAAD